jgi:hypothetical protein
MSFIDEKIRKWKDWLEIIEFLPSSAQVSSQA